MPRRKRAGASARKVARKLAPQPKPAAGYTRLTPFGLVTALPGRPLSYTPELKANARHRWEETPESAYSIAADLGMHHVSLKRLAKREGWVRRNPKPQRDVTPVMRLAAEVDELVADREAAPHPNPLPAGGERTELAGLPSADAIDRLEAAVLKEIATVEAIRQNLGSEPLRPLEARVTAQTLASLTETLAKLRRLRLAAGPAGAAEHDDEMPIDIDEFRDALARRIELFVASRDDARRDGGDRPAVVDEA